MQKKWHWWARIGAWATTSRSAQDISGSTSPTTFAHSGPSTAVHSSTSSSSSEQVSASNGPILTGWVRGIIEDKKTDKAKQKTLARFEAATREATGRPVCFFIFEGGAGLFVHLADGRDVLLTAEMIARAVKTESGSAHFYDTCSFMLSASELDLPEYIRRARSVINNHQEAAGTFFIDGKVIKIGLSYPPENRTVT